MDLVKLSGGKQHFGVLFLTNQEFVVQSESSRILRILNPQWSATERNT